MVNNIVLYRKYRPQNFSEVIGQSHVVQTLQNSIGNGAISHAYLFCGPRGSGKTSVARIFAKAINCQKPGLEPCNKCSNCLEIINSSSMDLVEVDAATHTGVDNIRELIDGLKFSPVKSKYKVFIMDEAHQLSPGAKSALLKTLEEPPPHAIFILATTEAHKMLPTIVSRCQRFDFRGQKTSEIIKKLEFILKKEGIAAEPKALNLIALNARGSFRDAESILDKCISFLGQDGKITAEEIKDLLGIVDVRQVADFVEFIVRQQVKDAILHIGKMAEQGVDLQEFAKTLIFYLRHCLLLKISSELLDTENYGFTEEEIETMKKQTTDLKEKDLQKMLEVFIEAENKMKYTTILQLPLELAAVDLTY